jgi:PhoH-like ATPase
MVDSLIAATPAKKIFVLDTNVFLYDPNALFVFKNHDLVIPITVIEEVDRFKKNGDETGRNARTFSRKMDGLRRRGSLNAGVTLEAGGTIRVALAHDTQPLPTGFGGQSNDNLILQTVLDLHRSVGSGNVILVTRDTNMRIKADALGIPAEDYEHAQLDIDEQYSGFKELSVDAEVIQAVYSKGFVEWGEKDGLFANQFGILSALNDTNQSAMVRYDPTLGQIVRVARHKEGVWGIFARNKEQLFALDLLLNDKIPLVTLDGRAGTGKTLIAIAAGLRKVTKEASHRRLLVSRPIFPLGRDVGFLPGDLEEKLNPWMKPIFDNLELLLSNSERPGVERRSEKGALYQPLLDQKIIEVEPLTYIRGRSIPQQFMIVDEAQNLTPHEVKTVITRAGEGTKIVLTGDPMQIDNPYVDATSNGLTYVVERFKSSELAGHITLSKGERSVLAERASQLL